MRKRNKNKRKIKAKKNKPRDLNILAAFRREIDLREKRQPNKKIYKRTQINKKTGPWPVD